MSCLTDKFIIQQTTLLKYPTAPARDITSLKNCHKGHDNVAIAPEEQTYLDCPGDLIPVAPRDKEPLRRTMDKVPFLRTFRLWRDDNRRTALSSGGGRRRIGDLEEGTASKGGHCAPSADHARAGRLPLSVLFPTVSFYSDKAMDLFVSVVAITLGVVMLVVPLWVLQALGEASLKLGVITAFVLACLLLTSFAMTSRPLEALGATAA